MWAERGSCLRAVRQTEYKWGYVFGAVDPVAGKTSALILPRFRGGEHLPDGPTPADDRRGGRRGPAWGLVLDGAGWHVAGDLEAPASMTLLFLPPYAPKRMPMERVWAWRRQHDLSNRVFIDGAHIDRACKESWNRLTPERMQTITGLKGGLSGPRKVATYSGGRPARRRASSRRTARSPTSSRRATNAFGSPRSIAASTRWRSSTASAIRGLQEEKPHHATRPNVAPAALV